MSRLLKAVSFSLYMLGAFVTLSFLWNTFRIGLNRTFQNLLDSMDFLALMTVFVTAILWIYLEVRYRGGLDDPK